MTLRRIRPVAASAAAVACTCAIAACGSSSHSSTSSAGSGSTAGPSRAGFKLTSTEQACLKKHGVSFGAGFGAGGRHRFDGRPPTGAKGTFKHGNYPHGSHTGQVPAAFAKTRAALKDCGVSFPMGGHGDGGPGAGGAPPAG